MIQSLLALNTISFLGLSNLSISETDSTMSPATLLRRISGFVFSDLLSSSSYKISSLESSDTKVYEPQIRFQVSGFRFRLMGSGLEAAQPITFQSTRNYLRKHARKCVKQESGRASRRVHVQGPALPEESWGQDMLLILEQEFQYRFNASRHLNVIYDAPGFTWT